MNEDARALLGACGLYCGACYHYRASLPEGQHLLAEVERRGRDPEGFTCKGCRSDALYVHPGCAECGIRACADEGEIEHCGLCAEFPCERIEAFQSDGRVHHRDILRQLDELTARGVDQWLVEQSRRWRCECGLGFSWYEENCNICGRPLQSYGPDPTI